MSALAGINRPNEFNLVSKMLDKMSHRASKVRKIFSTEDSTFGICSNFHSLSEIEKFQLDKIITHNQFNSHFVYAKEIDSSIELRRDFMGVVPLYYGFDDQNSICFASEIKALLVVTRDINELKPGTKFYKGKSFVIDTLKLPDKFISDSIETIASELRTKIENSIFKRIEDKDEFGSWLSGGIDSSVIASVASKRLKKLYTFSGGLKDSNDLKFARILAEHINSRHFEIVVNKEEILKVLPDVIYYLESFDSYLVRSSIINYIVNSKARDYIDEVFSGESGDELFAGYDYLKLIPINELPLELINITRALANTAFQRVDRSAYSNEIIPHVPFSDPDVVNYVLQIPPELKIKNGIEKWILREAMKDYLPEEIYNRPKEKFWQGSGLKNLLEEYAEAKITNFEFNSNRTLDNGFRLRTKEEYLYYKIFEEHFGEFENFDWLGFSKINSVQKYN